MERPRQDLMLGLVFFAGLALLLVTTLFLTGVTFEQTEYRTVWFDNAAGLRAGDNVFVLGVRTGQVESIAPDPTATDRQRKVVVRVRLDREVRITDAYEVRIEAGSLLGGQQIEIDPGDGPNEMAPAVTLQGTRRKDPFDAIGDLVSDPQIEADLKGILSNIRETFRRINEGEGTLARLLNDETLHRDAVELLESLRRNSEAIESGRGAVGRLIHDEAMGDDLAELVSGATSVVRKIDTGNGPLGRLINDEDLGDSLANTLANVEEFSATLNSGKGPLGLLFSDEQVAEDLRTIAGEFATFSMRLNDPMAGVIGALAADRSLRDRFVAIADDFGAVAAEIRDGRGLLGRLVFDDELGEQFSRMLNQVARAIEDAREAAPIGTFFQVATGAF